MKKPALFILSIVQNVLIGRSKQKIGNAVFTTWKGKNVLKSKPLTVENPRTDNQLMRRSALSQAVESYRGIANCIQVGWKELAIGMSEYNAFASFMLKYSFDYSTPPTATLVYSQVVISKGTIASTQITSASSSAGADTVTLNWDASDLQPGQSNSDKAIIVVVDTTTGVRGFVTNVSRSTETATVTLPFDITLGDTLECYLGFYNPTSMKAADSDHMQITAGA